MSLVPLCPTALGLRVPLGQWVHGHPILLLASYRNEQEISCWDSLPCKLTSAMKGQMNTTQAKPHSLAGAENTYIGVGKEQEGEEESWSPSTLQHSIPCSLAEAGKEFPPCRTSPGAMCPC